VTSQVALNVDECFFGIVVEGVPGEQGGVIGLLRHGGILNALSRKTCGIEQHHQCLQHTQELVLHRGSF